MNSACSSYQPVRRCVRLFGRLGIAGSDCWSAEALECLRTPPSLLRLSVPGSRKRKETRRAPVRYRRRRTAFREARGSRGLCKWILRGCIRSRARKILLRLDRLPPAPLWFRGEWKTHKVLCSWTLRLDRGAWSAGGRGENQRCDHAERHTGRSPGCRSSLMFVTAVLGNRLHR